MASTYELLKSFKSRHKSTISWYRGKKHAALVDKHLQAGEEVLYAFAAQKYEEGASIFNTTVLALTNMRIIIAQERFLTPGFKIISITPELYNDITIEAGLIWGIIKIDTMKETISLSSIARSALPEIQTTISSYMAEAKSKFNNPQTEENS